MGTSYQHYAIFLTSYLLLNDLDKARIQVFDVFSFFLFFFGSKFNQMEKGKKHEQAVPLFDKFVFDKVKGKKASL